MSVNLESGRTELTSKSSLHKIAAPSVTDTSAIVITLELEESGEKECYVHSREEGIGFTAIVQDSEPHTHFVNWLVIN